MFKIQTLNKISAAGLSLLPLDNYESASEISHPDAILVRSFKMHDMELPESLLAISWMNTLLIALYPNSRPISEVRQPDKNVRNVLYSDLFSAGPDRQATPLKTHSQHSIKSGLHRMLLLYIGFCWSFSLPSLPTSSWLTQVNIPRPLKPT